MKIKLPTSPLVEPSQSPKLIAHPFVLTLPNPVQALPPQSPSSAQTTLMCDPPEFLSGPRTHSFTLTMPPLPQPFLIAPTSHTGVSDRGPLEPQDLNCQSWAPVPNLNATDGHMQQTVNKIKFSHSDKAVSLSSPALTDKSKKKGKDKAMATRRSPRLQAKQCPTLIQKLPDRAKNLTAKLLFDLDTRKDPLDAGTTLSILQASGLQIDKHVEDLIDKAVAQDKCDDAQEQSPPTTPLHDHIPPLAVPGADLLL